MKGVVFDLDGVITDTAKFHFEAWSQLAKEKFDLNEFTMGINVELEHGTKFSKANVTNNDPILTGKIALAHLYEFPDYYVRLQKLEDEAKAYWSKK